MRWFDRFAQIAGTVALIGVIYLHFTLIQTLDRLHLSNVQLRDALEKRLNMPPANAAVQQGTPSVKISDAANAGYFDPAAKVGGRLVEALFADAPGFNPLTINEATASTIFSLCSATLAERDWQNPELFKPMLAQSWEISPDHLSYRIKLRKNAL